MFVGNEKKGGHLDRLMRLEKSTNLHKQVGRSSYFCLRVYLSDCFITYVVYCEPRNCVTMLENSPYIMIL